MPHSPALLAATSVENAAPDQAPVNRKPPFFFRDEYAGLIVKGNFMTLAAKPVHVEEGEWLAHQGLLFLPPLPLPSRPHSHPSQSSNNTAS